MTRHLRLSPVRALFALTAAAALATGCGRADLPEPPRLLTTAELATLSARAEAPPPENATEARAAGLRARAASLRTAPTAERRAESDVLRQRAARLSAAND